MIYNYSFIDFEALVLKTFEGKVAVSFDEYGVPSFWMFYDEDDCCLADEGDMNIIRDRLSYTLGYEVKSIYPDGDMIAVKVDEDEVYEDYKELCCTGRYDIEPVRKVEEVITTLKSRFDLRKRYDICGHMHYNIQISSPADINALIDMFDYRLIFDSPVDSTKPYRIWIDY